MPSPFKRTGLHRLECDGCPNYVYATVAALETHGLGRCPCGGTFTPARLELALLLGLEDGIAAEYGERVFAFQRGQHAAYRRNGHDGTRSAYDAVADEFARDYSERARARRLVGLGISEVKIGRERVRSAVSTDEIPF